MNERTDDLWAKWAPQKRKARSGDNSTQLTLNDVKGLFPGKKRPGSGAVTSNNTIPSSFPCRREPPTPARNPSPDPAPELEPTQLALTHEAPKPSLDFKLASGKPVPCTGDSYQPSRSKPTRRRETLHPKLEGGGEEAEKDHGEDDEVSQFKDLLRGEICEEHIRLVLSMKSRSPCQIQEDMIGGLESVKQIIKIKVIQPMLRPDLHKGLFSAARGVLFYGPPGTGRDSKAVWVLVNFENLRKRTHCVQGRRRWPSGLPQSAKPTFSVSRQVALSASIMARPRPRSKPSLWFVSGWLPVSSLLMRLTRFLVREQIRKRTRPLE
eukprot:Blabericola_migrator_1__6244@NODE_314_length_10020_cov_127_741485_g257_i0_p5_GENE_NODE_314_length_10020_cov_127_741485_g257_i0NODE_314_length_10020_cov_127_741485_g257_i0_p5_ORF_typecomplete_len323_score24_48_NODE_314_length_10020_cov_127_741485_g257_i074978465